MLQIFHDKNIFFLNAEIWIQPQPTEPESLADEVQDYRGFRTVYQVEVIASQAQGAQTYYPRGGE